MHTLGFHKCRRVNNSSYQPLQKNDLELKLTLIEIDPNTPAIGRSCVSRDACMCKQIQTRVEGVGNRGEGAYSEILFFTVK